MNRCNYTSSDEDSSEYENDEILINTYICILCQHQENDINSLCEHMKSEHKFDMISVSRSFQVVDDYQWIKFVNFLRKNKDNLINIDFNTKEWVSDEYLKPVLEDDNLLFIDFADLVNVQKPSEQNNELMEMEHQIQVKDRSIACLQDKVEELMTQMLNVTDSTIDIGSSVGSAVEKKLNNEDSAYFSGYSHHSIHDTMIKDKVRTESYRRFIEENGREFFVDKVVLDVGCGTGILSMFAARAGAKHVYGVDCADIIYDAMAIVEKNGFKDKITLIHGKLENINLPVDKVDVIISEWMGYMLVYESMLDSVLYACRRFLAPANPANSLAPRVFPGRLSLLAAAVHLQDYHKQRLECWDSVYGLDMSCMRARVTSEVVVDIVENSELASPPVVLRQYDLEALADSGVEHAQTVDQHFDLEVQGAVGGIVLYFDTEFLASSMQDARQVFFSTGPQTEPTHWQQCLLVLDQPLELSHTSTLHCHLSIDRHPEGARGLLVVLHINGKKHKFDFC